MPQSKSWSQSQSTPPDMRPVGGQVVLKNPGRHPHTTPIHSVFGPGPLPDPSQMRQKLTEMGILNVLPHGTAQWARFTATPARSGPSEVEVFHPFVGIISEIFNQLPNCQLACCDNPSTMPLSECEDTSVLLPDAYILSRCSAPAAKKIHWADIIVPLEFQKTNNHSTRHENEQKITWSLQNIMSEDPLRRFVFGITVEDTQMKLWYSNRAFLGVSAAIDFTTSIDDIISLFCKIGDMNARELGFDPTVECIQVHAGTHMETQYKFTICGQVFTTTRPLATCVANVMVGHGTRVYEAQDENGNIVVIKDSWRDEDHDLEGAILEKIFKDIQEKLGETELAKAKEYFIKVRIYEDTVISGELDRTLIPSLIEEDSLGWLEWITINAEPILSGRQHLPSVGPGHIPALTHGWVHPCSVDICRVHTRTVFEDVGIPLMDVTCLADSLTCLSDSLQGLHYLHQTGWVHRNISVANVIRVDKNGRGIGKLTDFEFATKGHSTVPHDIRTRTMDFMAVEVERQCYLFQPEVLLGVNPNSTPKPPFCMNFLHDLESHWWAALWVFLYYTDADSPTSKSEEQLVCFNQAFPHAIGRASHYHFFTKSHAHLDAYKALAATYRDGCTTIIQLAVDLQKSYEKVEESFPMLLHDDSILEDVHEKMLHGYSASLEKLEGLNIRLRPLIRERKKRNIEDLHTNQVGKKARRGE